MKKDMFEEVRDLGIVLKSHSKGSQSVVCPTCSHTRKKKSNPSLYLTVFDDHILWKCFHCDWSGGAGNSSNGPNRTADTTKRVYKAPDLQTDKDRYTSTLPEKALKYLEGRGISAETAKKNNLWWEFDGEKLCFPFFEGLPDGKGGYVSKVVNIKHRELVAKNMFQEKDCKQIFYGHAELMKSNHAELIIVEGEFDKLTLNELGFWNVVSVPAGAPQKEVQNLDSPKFAFLAHAKELIDRMSKVIIAVDNDNNGNVLKAELIKRIGKEKCWVVTWPDAAKDANDCLKDMGKDMVYEIMNEAKPCPVKGLFRVDQFEQEMLDYFHSPQMSGISTGWDNIDRFYRISTGELTVVTGIPNNGKSEWLDAMMVNLAKHNNWRFAVFSPENGKEKHVGKLVEKIVGRSIAVDSDDRMTEGEFINGVNWVNNKFFFLVADDEQDLPTLDWVLEKAKVAIMQYGIKGLVIDPYNELEHQLAQGASETHYISKFISRLKKFAKAYDVKIWIVAHPTKLQRDKDGETMLPTPYDISGSSNWSNKADNIIIVHRAATDNVTEIHVAKVRDKHNGRQGTTTLIYDRVGGTYSVPPVEDQNINHEKKKKKTAWVSNEGDDDVRTW